jgi:hypothetical protein
MFLQSVFGIATSRVQAEDIVECLKLAHFSMNDISTLFPDRESSHDFAYEISTKAPEGAIAGFETGGILSGALGWIAGIGALAIPGLGPFIAAGPIAAALSGAAIGATVGGIVGTVIGQGIPEFVAKRYEGKLQEGNIPISVHAKDDAEIHRARNIFTNACIEDICVAGESSTPKP